MSDAISATSSSTTLAAANTRFQPSSSTDSSAKGDSTKAANAAPSTTQTSTVAQVIATESKTTKNTDGTYGPKHTLQSPDATTSSKEVDVNI